MAKFEINIDVNGEAKIAQLKNNIGDLDNKAKSSQSSINSMANSLKGLAVATAATVAVVKLSEAFIALAKNGIEVNRTIENQINGLKVLAVMTSQNVDSQGNALTLQQKYNLAQQEAVVTMEKLRAINADTPHTLSQTADIYKSMYTTMKQGNVSSEQMIDLTKKISIAAGSAGIEFQALLSGVDGLATGTVEVSSEFGRFLKAIGLNNEALKASSNIYETINNKLKDVKGIQSYDTSISNLKNSFDELTATATKPFFDKIAEQADNLTPILNDVAGAIRDIYNSFKSPFELNSINDLNKRAVEVSDKIIAKKKEIDNAWFESSKPKLKSELRALQTELIAVNQQFVKVTSTVDTKAPKLVSNKREKTTTADEKKDLANWAKHKIELINETNLVALDGYDRQFKALEQWKADEIREYASVTGMKDVIEKNYLSKKSEIERKQISDLTKIKIEDFEWEKEWREKFDAERTEDEKKQADKAFEAKKKNAELIAGLFSGDLTETQSLNTKYDNLIQQMAETGQATNEQYEAVGKKYLTDLEKINQDQTNKLIEQVKAWGSIAQEFLTTAFNDVYDTIKDSYEPLIQSNQYLARSLDLQANMYKTFGQSGTGAVVGYQSQLATIQAQKLILSEQYDLMAKSMQFKKVLQPLFEVAGLAVAGYSAVSFNAQGVLSGTEFALNAQNLADTMTGFTDYQKQYISAVETFKEQMRSLADTLVSIAGSIYDAIPSFRDLYDTISGTNTYQIKAQIEALNYVKQYTNLDKNSLTTFVNDVLMAQSAFVTGAVDIAGSANEGLIQSVDIFSKYGLAVDSLNEKFANSLDVVANLISANEAGNKSILDFARTIRNELGASSDKQGARKTATYDFYKALSDYKKGNVDASTLLQYAGTLKGTLSSSSELKALALTLENVAQPQSTEDLLTKLNNQIANIMTVGMPVVNIAPAQSVEAQTLNVIEDTKSLIQQILDFLKNPIGSIADLIEKIIKAIVEAAEKIVKAVIQAVIDLAKGIFNLGVDIVKGFGNLLVDLGKTIVKGFVDAIKGIGGSMLGGAGDVLGDLWGGVTSGFGLWAQGGYTGYNNGIIDSTGQRVAGIVHEGEWVAPSWMVQSNSALFNALENSRLNNSVPQMGSAVLVSVNNQEVVQAISINTNYIQSMNNRITSMEAMFRQVTTGGNAMMIEMI